MVRHVVFIHLLGVYVQLTLLLQASASQKVDGSPENVSKFFTNSLGVSKVVDLNTGTVAYKDYVDKSCYIEKIDSQSIWDNGRTLIIHPKLLTIQQVLTIAGPTVSSFCFGWPSRILRQESNIEMRRKRSNQHYFVGRKPRGQTQSQYLNFGNENNEPGKAEAESTHHGTKAIVYGSRGMGQAQSQSGPFSCADCFGANGAQTPLIRPGPETTSHFQSSHEHGRPHDFTHNGHRPGPHGLHSQGHTHKPGGQIHSGDIGRLPGTTISQHPTSPGRQPGAPGRHEGPSDRTQMHGPTGIQEGMQQYGTNGGTVGTQHRYPGGSGVLQPGQSTGGQGGISGTLQPGQQGIPAGTGRISSPGDIVYAYEPDGRTVGTQHRYPGTSGVLQPGHILVTSGPGNIYGTLQPGQQGIPAGSSSPVGIVYGTDGSTLGTQLQYPGSSDVLQPGQTLVISGPGSITGTLQPGLQGIPPGTGRITRPGEIPGISQTEQRIPDGRISETTPPVGYPIPGQSTITSPGQQIYDHGGIQKPSGRPVDPSNIEQITTVGSTPGQSPYYTPGGTSGTVSQQTFDERTGTQTRPYLEQSHDGTFSGHVTGQYQTPVGQSGDFSGAFQGRYNVRGEAQHVQQHGTLPGEQGTRIPTGQTQQGLYGSTGQYPTDHTTGTDTTISGGPGTGGTTIPGAGPYPGVTPGTHYGPAPVHQPGLITAGVGQPTVQEPGLTTSPGHGQAQYPGHPGQTYIPGTTYPGYIQSQVTPGSTQQGYEQQAGVQQPQIPSGGQTFDSRLYGGGPPPIQGQGESGRVSTPTQFTGTYPYDTGTSSQTGTQISGARDGVTYGPDGRILSTGSQQIPGALHAGQTGGDIYGPDGRLLSTGSQQGQQVSGAGQTGGDRVLYGPDGRILSTVPQQGQQVPGLGRTNGDSISYGPPGTQQGQLVPGAGPVGGDRVLYGPDGRILSPGTQQIPGTGQIGGDRVLYGPDGRMLTTGSQQGQQVPGGLQAGQLSYSPEVVRSVGADDSDSQAQSSIQRVSNETQASASSSGRLAGGTAQSQVTGSYSGQGSFSASAGTNDGLRGAQTQVSANKDGAISSSQGQGGKGQSQAQVQMASDTGDTTSSAQTSGLNHGTNTQVQSGIKGGMADAQANGPGSTSSQAQIGFTPYDADAEHDGDPENPHNGGGTASASSGTHAGKSQVQINGKYAFGIRYTGQAQASSANSGYSAGDINLPTMKPIDFGKSYGKPAKQEKVTNIRQIEEGKILKIVTTSTTPLPDDGSDYDDDYDEPEESQPRNLQQQQQTRSLSHDALDPLEDIEEANMERSNLQLKHGDIIRAGEYIPGTNGYKIPAGFRGRVSEESNIAESNTRRVVFAAGAKTNRYNNNGDVRYGSGYSYQPTYAPIQYGFKSTKTYQPKFVSVTKSETGSRNIHTGKKTPSVYYTQSSTCGYFTNTCFYSNGKKICLPKPKANPDGSPIVCRN